MIEFTVVDRAGVEHVVSGRVDASVMEAIRDAGIDELLAICGGCCSCATCHVYVEAGNEHVSEPSEDESDLLDGSAYREVNSRLSCQLKLTATNVDLRVRVAPEE